MSLTKEDYGNIAAFLSRTQMNGLQEASVALVLFQKVQALANAPVADAKVEESSGEHDTKSGDK